MIFLKIFMVFWICQLSDTFSCHQCASTDAVWNWVKYGLPVSQGDSVISDDKCLDETKLKKDGDSCKGLCVTINITRSDGDNKGKTIAMVRDCESKARKSIELKETDGVICDSFEKFVNRRNVNITTCYCRGHYCNGIGSAEALKKLRSPPILADDQTSRSSENNSSFPWLIVHLSLISFLY